MDEMAQNWQSEFSQIIREVVGLAILRFVGSPISKGDEERYETIFRKILEKQLEPQEARQFLKELEQKYPKS
jgi:transcription elongation factor GreA-like protein